MTAPSATGSDPDAPNGRRVLILGLDGADWRVLDRLLDRGRLPAVGALIEAGVRMPLASTIPPLTAPAWTSFLLGAGPGFHGISDFLERDARRYEGTTGRVTTSRDYPPLTMFDVAGSVGRRVGCVRVPMMLPPWPVNGVVVSGGFTPGGRVYCEPAELAERLEVGPIDIGKKMLEYPDEKQARVLEVQLGRVEEQARTVFALEPFDLAMVHVHTPDNAHHGLWHHLDRPAEDNLLFRMYELVDGFVGRMAASEDWDLIVLASDHGGGPRPARRMLVNRWLADLGLLTPRGGARAGAVSLAGLAKRSQRVVHRVRRWAPEGLRRRISAVTQAAVAIDWSSTTAYATHLFTPYYGVEVNVRGRQPAGSVEPDDLAQRALEVRRTLEADAAARGLPVVQVLTREEAFGPGADERLPDLVVRLEDDVQGEGGLSGELVRASPPRVDGEGSGGHSREGMLVLSGSRVRRGSLPGADIVDVAPTVLAYLGVPIPPHMTGSALHEAFEAGALHEVRGGAAATSTTAGSTLSESEEEEILASLRGLGYVE